jgi:hypothetical protein
MPLTAEEYEFLLTQFSKLDIDREVLGSSQFTVL